MSAAIFGPVAVAFTPLLLVLYLVPILGIVDASKRSAVAFYQAGYNKTAWIVVMAVAMILSFGFFPAGYYLILARRKVARFDNPD